MTCVSGSQPIEEFVACATDELLDRYNARVRNALAEGEDPESIHDLRVAIRRLRNALWLFKTFYRKRPRKEARRELKKIMKSAGKVRDQDIAAQIVASVATVDVTELAATIRGERAARKDKLDRLLKRERKTHRPLPLRASFGDAGAPTADPEGKIKVSAIFEPGATAEENARKVLPIFLTDVLKQAKEPMTQPSLQQLHRLRISLKRLRDTLELFGPCYDLHLERFIKMLKELHQVLGDLNDMAATRELLAEQAASSRASQVISGLDQKIGEKIPDFFGLLHRTLGDEETARHWVDYLGGRE